MQDKISLQEQRKIMMNLLIEFDNFCNAHQLNYFLDAGTLLGAVRHKGFIPWDDDIDICMPRIDYDRLLQIVREDNGYICPHIQLELPEKTVHPFAKISDDRTILIEYPHKYPIKMGVYMDVFAKDGIMNKSLSSKALCKISELLGLIHWFNKFSIHAWQKDSNLIKRIVSFLGRTIIRRPNIAVSIQDRVIHWNCKRHPLDICEYVTTLTNGEYHKLAPKECFSNYIMLDFEEKKFRCPIGYDTYLKCLYPGDYMQLPPEEKRVHHDTVIYWKSVQDKEDFYKNKS